MGIENLLAQGVQIRPEGMERNALMQYQQFQDAKQKNALMQMQMQDMHAQRQQALQAAQQVAADRARVEQFRQSIPSPQMQANQQALAGGGGPTVGNAAQMRPVDPRLQMLHGAMQAGMGTPMDYINAANPKNKIKDYKSVRAADGSVSYVGLTEDGRVVQTGQQPFEKPEVKSFGNFMGGIDPITGKVTQYGAIGQSADNKANNATAMRGQNMVNDRARETLAQGGKPPAGYRWKADGTMEAIPGGPADTKVGGAGAKVQDATEALALLNQAEPLLKGSTGSYGGKALDILAGAFGASTDGSIKAQQLKAIEGALVAKMPKMSGPQSDKDVLLYRQMAAVIGDETVPYARKAAAVESVREIQERYAGVAPGSSKPRTPAIPVNPIFDYSAADAIVGIGNGKR